MSFTEAEHPRATDGRFAEKVGGAPEVGLSGNERDAGLESINQSIELLRDPNFDAFPLADQEAAIAAVNSRYADEETLKAANELAEASESWNFHDTALKLWAGISRKHHAADPEAPIEHAYALAYDPSTPHELIDRVVEEKGGSVTYALLSNPEAPSKHIDTIAASPDAWIRQRVVLHPKVSDDALRALADDDDEAIRENAKVQLSYRVRASLAENWEGRDSDQAV